MNSNIILKIKNLDYSFKQNLIYDYKLIKNLDFELNKKSISSLLAPSGAGKSTLFKLIAENNNSCITYDGKVIFYFPKTSVSLPWLNPIENVKHLNNEVSNDTIGMLLKEVGLEGYETHIPHNNSLGFRFRIILAAALSFNPELILIDDTFLEMDSKTKYELFNLIYKIRDKLNITFLYATSNYNDALLFAENLFIAKDKPLEIVLNEILPNNKQNIFEKINDNDFLDFRSKIGKDIKLHDLSNVIL